MTHPRHENHHIVSYGGTNFIKRAKKTYCPPSSGICVHGQKRYCLLSSVSPSFRGIRAKRFFQCDWKGVCSHILSTRAASRPSEDFRFSSSSSSDSTPPEWTKCNQKTPFRSVWAVLESLFYDFACICQFFFVPLHPQRYAPLCFRSRDRADKKLKKQLNRC